MKLFSPSSWNPLNQRRWINFRNNKRGFWSLILFSIIFTLTLFAEVIANDKPLVVSYRDQLYFPFVQFYPETTFGGDFATEADYRDDFVAELINAEGWM